jgi:hypothetical protein
MGVYECGVCYVNVCFTSSSDVHVFYSIFCNYYQIARPLCVLCVGVGVCSLRVLWMCECYCICMSVLCAPNSAHVCMCIWKTYTYVCT